MLRFITHNIQQLFMIIVHHESCIYQKSPSLYGISLWYKAFALLNNDVTFCTPLRDVTSQRNAKISLGYSECAVPYLATYLFLTPLNVFAFNTPPSTNTFMVPTVRRAVSFPNNRLAIIRVPVCKHSHTDARDGFITICYSPKLMSPRSCTK